jgi:hypothetical protein
VVVVERMCGDCIGLRAVWATDADSWPSCQPLATDRPDGHSCDSLASLRREDVGIVRAGAVAAAGTLIDLVGAPIAADRALIVGAGPSGLELGIVMPSWM